MKIELTNMETLPRAKAHKFPIQIAFQTMEFMQGSIFHQILSDTASGQRVRQRNAIDEIEQELLQEGMDKSTWEESWKYLQKYQEIFTKSARQSVLITLRSQWDWYISHLGKFINDNYLYVFDKELSSNKQKDLLRIGFKEITHQIKILSKVINENIDIDLQTKDYLNEMSLVRNLGLHNRWEVDHFYLQKTKSSGWKFREVRLFEINELEMWHSSLIRLINSTWKPIAIKFKDAPEYTI